MKILTLPWLAPILTLGAMLVLFGVPFVMRPPSARLVDPVDLVIVSPHDEAVKAEFERAFSDWHEARFGQPVKVVWLNVGGTGDITRYVESKFSPQFRRAVGTTRPDSVKWAWVDGPRTSPAPDPWTAKAVAVANAGIDIDIFFGAGDFEHGRFKKNGWLARYDLPTSVPDDDGLTSDYFDVVPGELGGQPLYDSQHYWYGAVITRVGIVANNVVCRKLHLDVPRTWADLAKPCYRDQLALADPMSGSAKLCYETLLESAGERPAGWVGEWPGDWTAGWRMLTNIAANARYFSSGSTQVALDISRCEAAAGMIIDYYGRTQVNYVGRDPASGQFRLSYCSPAGATASTPDPISIFRGAPNPLIARRFVQFVLSEAGQKLWMGKIENGPDGEPLYGGPKRFQLYRPPIRQDTYEKFRDHMICPEGAAAPENPFAEISGFNMNGRVQGRRFNFLGVLMRAAFIDNGDLLQQAADYARRAAIDSPARHEFDEPLFPPGDFAAKTPAAGSLWARVDEFNKAEGDIKRERIAADLTAEFRAKYRRVLAAPPR